jgi:hypothetical protein
MAGRDQMPDRASARGLAGTSSFNFRAKMLEQVAPTREREFLFDDEAAILERFVAKRIADQK